MAAEQIGFVGTGRMGEPIARNLLEAGNRLVVFNRTGSKADGLVAQGARRAPAPGDVCSPGGLVLTMVSDDAALEEIVSSEGFLPRLAPGGVHVSMSTVSPRASRAVAQLHAGAGSGYVAAPVFGRPEAAASRKLWVCLSGAPEARARALEPLRAIGQGVFELGDDPGAANVAKLCGNFLIAAAMEAMAEAFALGEKNGIAPKALADLFGGTLFACPIYQNYGKTIAERRFSPAGFAMPLGVKDLGLVLETAALSNTPMPVAGLVRDRLLSAMARGWQDLDWSALARAVREDAGLTG